MLKTAEDMRIFLLGVDLWTINFCLITSLGEKKNELMKDVCSCAVELNFFLELTRILLEKESFA